MTVRLENSVLKSALLVATLANCLSCAGTKSSTRSGATAAQKPGTADGPTSDGQSNGTDGNGSGGQSGSTDANGNSIDRKLGQILPGKRTVVDVTGVSIDYPETAANAGLSVLIQKRDTDVTVNSLVLGEEQLANAVLIESTTLGTTAIAGASALVAPFVYRQTITRPTNLANLVAIIQTDPGTPYEVTYAIRGSSISLTDSADAETVQATIELQVTHAIVQFIEASTLPPSVIEATSPPQSQAVATGAASAAMAENRSITFTAKPGNSSGEIDLSLTIGTALTSFHHASIFRRAGPTAPYSCDEETGIAANETPLTETSVTFTDAGRARGNIYSYQACAYDAEGTLLDTLSKENVTAPDNPMECDSGRRDTVCEISTTKLLKDADIFEASGDVVVKSGGVITAPVAKTIELRVTGTIRIESGGKLTANSKLTVGNLRVETGGEINLNSTGLPVTSFRGCNGLMDGSYGGGGYGGKGGNGTAGNGLAAFGSEQEPIDFGTAGITGCGAAGAGGGRLQVSATNEVAILGNVTANGGVGGQGYNNHAGAGGGGSGGSIWIIAKKVTGSGTLAANGGNGPYGAAGGGGRISLHFITNLFSGALTADMGTGPGAPADGTIYERGL